MQGEKGMSRLREIGEEFWYEFPMAPMETEKSRFLYRVVGHSQCLRFIGDTNPETSAELKPIRHQKATLTGYKPCNGECGTMIPQFGEWREA